MTKPYTLAQLAAYADPELDQHFLVDSDKLRRIIAAAEIMPTDRVLEIGAGMGTVARELPPRAKLTLVELDSRLIEPLRAAVPAAEVVQADALELIHVISFDVLIGNLPHEVTIEVLRVLPKLDFRTALITMAENTDLTQLTSVGFRHEIVTRIGGSDFSPPQDSFAQVVKLWRPR